MRITFLGAGTWGFCLAHLLSSKGHEIVVWTRDSQVAEELQKTRAHPKLPQTKAPDNVTFTTSLAEALEGTELIAEAVTTKGIRPVFTSIKEIGVPKVPIVLASKGIERGTGLLLPEILLDVLGEDYRPYIACLSGPGHAEEVVRRLPSSVSSSAYEAKVMELVAETFTTPWFRVYPNPDINGVSFGGAMKNIMAIACGISDGLGLGDGAKAALMTRGLHEIRKLSVVKGCHPETLNGLSGLGDLAVTCISTHSRNNRFGRYIAEGLDAEAAAEKVGMVVEGVNTCQAAVEMSRQAGIATPIADGVYEIVFNGRQPLDMVQALMTRTIKKEHL